MHRKIVSAHSKKNLSRDEIVLKNVDAPSLEAVIHYIYVGYIELTNGNIKSVLTAAKSMEIESLEEKCKQYLRENVDAENCVDTLMLADKYNLVQLRGNALQLVRENFVNIPIAAILRIDGKVFTELLESDEIEAPETYILKILIRWAVVNGTENAKIMPELLKRIRLNCLPAEVMQSIYLHTKIIY